MIQHLWTFRKLSSSALYLVAPEGNGDFGVPVHRQVVGVPHQPEAAGVEGVVQLVLEPDQRR